MTAFAVDTLSYSGRLVQASGAPVAGPVKIRADLAYTNATGTVLCTDEISNVALSKGVFHVKIDFDCSLSGKTLTQVLSQTPSGHSVAIQITDITDGRPPKSYSFQALHALPFATVASQLAQMGANDGEFLKWNDTDKKWEAGNVSGASGGTVTNVTATSPLSVTSGATTPALTISQANGTTSGYLSSTDWNTFNNKEGTLAGGTATQYYRGDKTWQTLDTSAVPENVNLYFTNARVLGLALTGFSATNAAIVATDTVVQGFSKAQGQINSINTAAGTFLVKNSSDVITGTVNVGATGFLTITNPPSILTDATNKQYVDNADNLKVNKAGDTVSGVLTLDNDLKVKGGSNYVTVKGNAATAASYNFVLPTTAGTSGQFLQTDGSGNLSWVAQSSSATPSGTAGGELAGTYPNPTIKANVITDSHIATTLSQSKITNLTTDLANKQSTTLANGNILVGSGTNIATAVSVSGDATLSNSGVLTLANTAVTAGTYNSVTVDSKGRVTGGTAGTVVSSVTVNAPITNSGTATAPVLNIAPATSSANGYLTSTDWSTFNNKQATISKTTIQDVSKLRIYGANTTNYVELSAATLTGNRSLIFPDSNGASGNVLATDGAGNLSWTSLATASPVTSVNSLTGAVSLTTSNVAEGTNLYYTNTRGISSTITAPTLTNSAIATGDTLQVVAGKLQAQFNNILNLALTGFSTATSAAVTAADSIIGGFGKLQAQINTLTALDSNKLSKNSADSITATITVSGAGDILVPTTPAGVTSAVNKSYVDTQVAGASNQWTVNSGNVYRSSGNVGIGTTPSQKLDVNGHTRIGSTSSGIGLLLDRPAGNYGEFKYMSGGIPRWSLYADAGAESGSNLGSDFVIQSYNDAGSPSGVPIKIIRSSGDIIFNGGGKVGVGTASPASQFHVSGTGYNTFDRYGANSSHLMLRTANGTPAAPTALLNGDTLGVLSFQGYTGSAFTTMNTAGILVNATENWSGTNQGSKIEFRTTANGSSSANPRMAIDHNGNVGIGTLTPSQKLDVAGNIQSNDTYFTLVTFADGWATGDYKELVYASAVGGAGNSGIYKIALSATRNSWTESSTFTTITSHSDPDVWREIPVTVANYYTAFTYRCFSIDANTTSNIIKFRIRAIRPSSDCSSTGTGVLPIYLKFSSEGYNGGWVALTATGSGATVTGYRTTNGSEWNLYTGASKNAGLPTITAKEGRVGIGTNNPGNKLEVHGRILSVNPSGLDSGGNYIGFATETGDLPGYPSSNYSLIKTNSNYVYFSIAGSYSSYISAGGTYTAISDKNKKENFVELDPEDMRKRIDELPITQWNYKAENKSIKHIGPMAQDFHRLFGLNGSNNKMIAQSDTSGVAIAGVKALSSALKKIENSIKNFYSEFTQSKKVIADQQAQINALESKNAELEARLKKIEESLDRKPASK